MAKKQEQAKLEIVVQSYTHPTGMSLFNFKSTGALLDETCPTVNLSRTGENPNCNFRIDNLQGHAKHTPPWTAEQMENGEQQTWMDRVQKDVNDAVKSYKGTYLAAEGAESIFDKLPDAPESEAQAS